MPVKAKSSFRSMFPMHAVALIFLLRQWGRVSLSQRSRMPESCITLVTLCHDTIVSMQGRGWLPRKGIAAGSFNWEPSLHTRHDTAAILSLQASSSAPVLCSHRMSSSHTTHSLLNCHPHAVPFTL